MREPVVVAIGLVGAALLPSRADAGEAAAGSAADPHIGLVCTPAGKPAPPELLPANAQVTNGIVHEERVTPDHTRLELRWRPAGQPDWTGSSLIPPDLEQCQPLLLDEGALLAACRPQDVDGRAAAGRRLVRLSPGQEPRRLAQALPLPGNTHLHPLDGGRLLVWAEVAERGPGDVGGDELTAAEVDASGRVVQQAIVSRPYLRRGPLGRGFLLLRQPPVGSGEPATYWRTEWDLTGHRLVFVPEQRPRSPRICEDAGPDSDRLAPARLSLAGARPFTVAVRLQATAGPAGACVSALDGRLLPDGGLAELRARRGRLEGRVWLVKTVSRAHPSGGVRRIPQISAQAVTCRLARR